MLHNVQVDVVRWRHGAEAGEYYRIRFAGRLWGDRRHGKGGEMIYI